MFKRLGTLKTNLIANFVNQCVNIGFPLALQYYIVRTLRLDDLGIWYVLAASIALGQLIASITHLKLVGEFAKSEEEQVKRELVGASILVGLFLSLCVMPVFILYFVYLGSFGQEHFDIILLAFSAVMTASISVESYYQGNLLNAFIMKRRIVIRLIYLVCVFTLVKSESDFKTFVYISIFAFWAEHFTNLVILRIKNMIGKPKFSNVWRIFKESVIYLPFNASYNTLPHLSILVMERFATSSTVALYSIFMRIINVATTFVSSSTIVLYPYMIKHDSNKLKILGLKVLVAISVAIGLVLFRDYILSFFVGQSVDPAYAAEYNLLTLFVIFHIVYNYVVFTWYVANNALLVPIIINVIGLLVFFTIVKVRMVMDIGLVYAEPVVISVILMTSLCILVVYMQEKGKRGDCGSLRI